MKYCTIFFAFLLCLLNNAEAQDPIAKCKSGDYDECETLCNSGSKEACDILNLKSVNPNELILERRNQVIDSNTKKTKKRAGHRTGAK